MCVSLTLLEGMHTELGFAVIAWPFLFCGVQSWQAVQLPEPVEWVWQCREADGDLLISHKCSNSSSLQPSKAVCNYESTMVVKCCDLNLMTVVNAGFIAR